MNSDTYPPQQGNAAPPAYPSQGYPQGGGYTNYAHPQYYPPTAASYNNNQAVVVTQNAQTAVVEYIKDYTCLAVFAIFMFLPTGIVALLKSNDAQNEYRMGNIEKARESNKSASFFVKISVILGVVLIALCIIIPVVVFFGIYNRYSDLVEDTFKSSRDKILNSL